SQSLACRDPPRIASRPHRSASAEDNSPMPCCSRGRNRRLHSIRSSSGAPIHPPAHFRFHAIYDFVEGQLRTVEDDGVFSRDHGCNIAGGVAAIALLLCPQNFIERELVAARDEVAVPATCALRRIGDEEELTGGVGKDHGTLIAALAHHVAA